MRVILDVRKASLRGSERLLFDVMEEASGRIVSLPPQPIDLAFDTLQITIMDMLDSCRESGMTTAIRPATEAATALIPRTPKARHDAETQSYE